MGSLRLLLALAVVEFHSVHVGGWAPLWPATPNGVVAVVQAFFCISGFYMALILSTQYQDRPFGFYCARLMRLWPIYWIVLALTVVALGWPPISGWLGLWNGFANVTLLGLDVNSAFWPSLLPVIVSPAWTLGIELAFYATAPWLNRLRSSWLVALMAFSIGARLVTYSHGLDHEPWLYRFFPFELAWFLAGMLAYRAYAFGAASNLVVMRCIGVAALSIMVGLLLFYREIWNAALGWQLHFVVKNQWAQPLFDQLAGDGQLTKLLMPLALPFVFALTKDSRLERLVGEFSYPVYICHFPLLQLMQKHQTHSGLLLMAGTVLIASLLLAITMPIERYRQRRAQMAAER